MPRSAESRARNITAQAAVFTGAGRPMQVRRFPVLPPATKDVLLRLESSGICGTDIHIATGRLALPAPFISGHEFVGRVEALGSRTLRDGLGRALRPGDRAITCVAIPCGTCFSCRRGETASCLSFGVTYLRDPAQPPHLFGGFGEYLHSPARNLVVIPRSLPTKVVAAFPCAGPTVVRAMDFAGGVCKGELVVVQGAGAVGLFATAWAAAHGCTVLVIASRSNPARLRLARQLGAAVVLDRNRIDATDRLARVRAMAKKLGRGDGADVVFEASGDPAALPEGLNLVRTLGRYVVPGQYSNSGGVEIQPHLITFRAIKIIGSGQYKLADVARYLAFLQSHRRLHPAIARCVTHRYRVSQVNRALADIQAGRVVKGILVP